MTKFGSESQDFEALNQYAPGTTEKMKAIADQFASMVKSAGGGWHRGSVDYFTDADGNVTKIGELKIMYSGPQQPIDAFDGKSWMTRDELIEKYGAKILFSDG